MHFALICHDKPNAQALRAQLRPSHLEWAKAYLPHIKLAGPFLSEDGEAMIGSLFILEFSDRKSAEAFCASDPYAKGGLFASVQLIPWRRTLGMALD
jgi:uncharacterized protein YciI